jgi:hypothetical protein
MPLCSLSTTCNTHSQLGKETTFSINESPFNVPLLRQYKDPCILYLRGKSSIIHRSGDDIATILEISEPAMNQHTGVPIHIPIETSALLDKGMPS